MDVQASLRESNERTLEWLTTVHQNILDATKTYVDSLPATPEWPVGTPSTPEIPDVKTLIADAFDFQAKVVEENKKFSLALADTWAAATSASPGEAGSPPVANAGPAAKK